MGAGLSRSRYNKLLLGIQKRAQTGEPEMTLDAEHFYEAQKVVDNKLLVWKDPDINLRRETDPAMIGDRRAVTCTDCGTRTPDHRVEQDDGTPSGALCKRCHDALVADGRASWRPWA